MAGVDMMFCQRTGSRPSQNNVFLSKVSSFPGSISGSALMLVQMTLAIWKIWGTVGKAMTGMTNGRQVCPRAFFCSTPLMHQPCVHSSKFSCFTHSFEPSRMCSLRVFSAWTHLFVGSTGSMRNTTAPRGRATSHAKRWLVRSMGLEGELATPFWGENLILPMKDMSHCFGAFFLCTLMMPLAVAAGGDAFSLAAFFLSFMVAFFLSDDFLVAVFFLAAGFLSSASFFGKTFLSFFGGAFLVGGFCGGSGRISAGAERVAGRLAGGLGLVGGLGLAGPLGLAADLDLAAVLALVGGLVMAPALVAGVVGFFLGGMVIHEETES